MGNVYKQKNHSPKKEREVEEVMAYVRSYGAIEILDYANDAMKANTARLAEQYGRPLTDRENMLTMAAVLDSLRDEISATMAKDESLPRWIENCNYKGQTIKFKQREDVDNGNGEIGIDVENRAGNGLQQQNSEGDKQLANEASPIRLSERLRTQSDTTKLHGIGNEAGENAGHKEN